MSSGSIPMFASRITLLLGLAVGAAFALPVSAKEAPKDTERVLQMLQAWHETDVPGGQAWSHWPDAGPALVWLGENGQLVRDRRRALAALQFFPSTEHRDRLLKIAADPNLNPLIRAGALRGLKGQTLSADLCRQFEAYLHDTPLPMRVATERLLLSPACPSAQRKASERLEPAP